MHNNIQCIPFSNGMKLDDATVVVCSFSFFFVGGEGHIVAFFFLSFYLFFILYLFALLKDKGVCSFYQREL